MSKSEMLRVSPSNPCPVCDSQDWCGFSEDGAIAICMRVPSTKVAKNGGYVHFLKDRPDWKPPPPRKRRLPPPTPTKDFATVFEKMKSFTTTDQLVHLATDFGMELKTIQAIGPAKAPEYFAWAFPMRDHNGNIIGIRLRNNEGRKWAVTGSKAGLFLGGDGKQPLICEGPTDSLAAIQLGFAAVGRPSCLGQELMVKRYLRKFSTFPIIMADRDQPKERPDGSMWAPGMDGATRLAKAIGKPCVVVKPPYKDLREWWEKGVTKVMIMALAKSAKWVNVD